MDCTEEEFPFCIADMSNSKGELPSKVVAMGSPECKDEKKIDPREEEKSGIRFVGLEHREDALSVLSSDEVVGELGRLESAGTAVSAIFNTCRKFCENSARWH